jgi:hypothetical protein
MKKIFTTLATLLYMVLSISVHAEFTTQKKDMRLYELRVYYCEPGRLDALLDRFKNHASKLFEKHGMKNIGYWVPIENKENKMYYILSFPDKESREASWESFESDPIWVNIKKETERSGKFVARIESFLMYTTDFSNKVKASPKPKDRVFELRTYSTYDNKLPNLLTRFRDHTTKLFEKHGMTNIAYWQLDDDSTLFYLLAHDTVEQGKKSFDTFRTDPEWIKVRDASEKDGKIVEAVISEYARATDFSPIK